MHRLFETSKKRRNTYLSGNWNFMLDPEDKGEKEEFYRDFPLAESSEIHVPCAWNAYPQYYDYEGVAWYHKKFYLAKNTNIRLYFGAVAHQAKVYLDGEKLGDHYGGFTAFEFLKASLAEGDHELIVKVDNIHNQNTIPKPKVDWFHYGGITRPVLIEEVQETMIDGIKVDYQLNKDRAEIELELKIYNFQPETTDSHLKIFLNENLKVEKDISVNSGINKFTVNLVGKNIKLWSLTEPVLYDLKVDIAGDDLTEKIGFRKIEIVKNQILLNGKSVKIKGINRHEDHPDWGFALPPRLIQQDVDIIKKAGLNSVRTSHYPNNPVFLDYCDKEGILVVEEIPYWQFNVDDFSRKIVLQRGKKMLAEMIERDYNHPSIFAWSVHNECETFSRGLYKPTEELVATVREKDNSRLVTFASFADYQNKEDLCFNLVDFLCVNAYFGWYSDDLTWEEFIGKLHENNPDKPIIISEFGAGAVKNERTFYNQKWSEGYQADILEETVQTFLESDYLAGFYIWQFCDTRTAKEVVMGRPKHINNKGIVDAYRYPKEAFNRLMDLLN